jgi:hypothetical protein
MGLSLVPYALRPTPYAVSLGRQAPRPLPLAGLSGHSLGEGGSNGSVRWEGTNVRMSWTSPSVSQLRLLTLRPTPYALRLGRPPPLFPLFPYKGRLGTPMILCVTPERECELGDISDQVDFW